MTDAAVLLPLYGWPDEPGLVFTERRADLRAHPALEQPWIRDNDKTIEQLYLEKIAASDVRYDKKPQAVELLRKVG